MKINGLPVKDAKRGLIINVTTADVNKAKTKDPSKCAAAVACKREYKMKDIKVHLSKAYIRENNHYVRYNVPQALRTEIVSFDRSKTFEPGDYKLNPITPRTSLGKKKPTGPKHNSGKARKVYHITAGVRPHATV